MNFFCVEVGKAVHVAQTWSSRISEPETWGNYDRESKRLVHSEHSPMSPALRATPAYTTQAETAALVVCPGWQSAVGVLIAWIVMKPGSKETCQNAFSQASDLMKN